MTKDDAPNIIHPFLNPKAARTIQIEALKEAIRPAGYFNQKAKKNLAFNEFDFRLDNKVSSREKLLSVWGIGPETADSILLYAYKQLGRIPKKSDFLERNIENDLFRQIQEQRRAKAQR